MNIRLVYITVILAEMGKQIIIRTTLIILILLHVSVIDSNAKENKGTYYRQLWSNKHLNIQQRIKVNINVAISLYQHELNRLEKEQKRKKKIERENDIYRAYLANRATGSSIHKDFLTMRY